MKRTSILIATFALGATAVYAAETPPSEVVFGEYGAVAESLSGAPGDAASGAKVFANRKQGNCLACHQNGDMPDALFQGEIGPSLDDVGNRWEEAELRGIVANAKKVFEGTIMPGFYRGEGYVRPLEKFAGKPILTAQQVEDVVAYLMTLKEQ